MIDKHNGMCDECDSFEFFRRFLSGEIQRESMGYDYYQMDDLDVKEFSGLPTFHCPNCGFEYTHHEKTIVHGWEDWWEKEGEKIEVEDWKEAMQDEEYDHCTKGIGISVDSELNQEQIDVENPSSRRDAVSLIFSCENCTRLSAVRFIQHKGNTFVGTDVLEEKKDVVTETRQTQDGVEEVEKTKQTGEVELV